MKHLCVLFVLLVCPFLLLAQEKKSLLKSKTNGTYTYIYKINDAEHMQAFIDAKKITKSFLHTLIDSFKVGEQYKNVLPFGNYLHVTARANKLQFVVDPVRNVELRHLPGNNESQFVLIGTDGALVTDAQVLSSEGAKIRYDKDSRAYSTPVLKKRDILTVTYRGMVNLFYFHVDRDYSYMSPGRKNTFNEDGENLYAGYIAFNKPRYKPLDTVRFKAYMVNKSGSPVDQRPVTVKISGYSQKGKTILQIDPYSPGAYSGSFVLHDSLHLDLDETHTLSLHDLGGSSNKKLLAGNFRYEDYELKSVNFTARTDPSPFMSGKPFNIYLKAVNENGLAVPDGRVS
ncbi:MAG: hypothetical protein EOP48_26590, partial [Sphingobacteriales bacterium]